MRTVNKKIGRTEGARRNFPHIYLGMSKVWVMNIYGNLKKIYQKFQNFIILSLRSFDKLKYAQNDTISLTYI
jgi:hypothetical protein